MRKHAYKLNLSDHCELKLKELIECVPDNWLDFHQSEYHKLIKINFFEILKEQAKVIGLESTDTKKILKHLAKMSKLSIKEMKSFYMIAARADARREIFTREYTEIAKLVPKNEKGIEIYPIFITEKIHNEKI